MQEADQNGAVTCNSNSGSTANNTANCATINKYGANLAMIPGKTITTNITIKNTGSVPATAFALLAGACTQSTNGTPNGGAIDVCAKFNLVIKSGTKEVYSGTVGDFTQNVNLLTKLGTTEVAPSAIIPFSFAVTLDSSAGNSYQGMQIAQPMTWTFGA